MQRSALVKGRVRTAWEEEKMTSVAETFTSSRSFFERLPPVMVKEVLGFVPVVEVQGATVVDGVAFRLTSKLHRKVFDDCFGIFFPRDYPVKSPDTFCLTMKPVQSNGGPWTTFPIQKVGDVRDSQFAWKSYYTLLKCVQSVEGDESFVMDKRTSDRLVSQFNIMASSIWKIYQFDRKKFHRMFEILEKGSVVTAIQENVSLWKETHSDVLNLPVGLKNTLIMYAAIQNGESIQATSRTRVGQLGGYSCYNLLSQMRLMQLIDIDANIKLSGTNADKVVFALDHHEVGDGIRKCYFIDQEDAWSIKLGYHSIDRVFDVQTIVPGIDDPKDTARSGEPFVTFLQKFANRLDNGCYEIDKYLGGISIFPNHGKYFTKCITRNEHFPNGISCTCSTIPLPMTGFGWAYSIRIKVLPDPSNTKRCQLVSRHWAIGLRTGETRRVSGPGVVGKFPVFSTHSFIHVEPNPRSRLHLTESAEGEEFVYQSCTGQDELTTSFGGRLTFRLVPPEELAGDHIAFNNIPIDRGLGLFDVEVKSFPIDRYEDVEDNWVL